MPPGQKLDLPRPSPQDPPPHLSLQINPAWIIKSRVSITYPLPTPTHSGAQVKIPNLVIDPSFYPATPVLKKQSTDLQVFSLHGGNKKNNPEGQGSIRPIPPSPKPPLNYPGSSTDCELNR
ncbi:hypothetical protein DSO57_1001223 [Entomophthora muscae]|uniref:Uncharacterized protein n=1 Tax=Entomophthora muscae TaxID=34485 RepID=A0ACC2SMH7_9FUNG|nr:hypothetical protein DSO57_1001223 [Entomophthora muscae]